jgi:hypothetical protein
LVVDEYFLMNDLTLGFEHPLVTFADPALLDDVLDLEGALVANPLYGTPAGSELGLWAGVAVLSVEASVGYQHPGLLAAIALAGTTPDD